MSLIPASVQRLIDEFAKLPGIGPRTAERLTFYLIRADADAALSLGQALQDLRTNLQTCQTCFNLADQTICSICSDSQREHTLVCVVEEPLDVTAIEKTGLFHGVYHVLGGVISPIEGIGPDSLTIASLIKRVRGGEVKELILATNPSTEGETTAMYIRKQLEGLELSLTRLARGLPVGGDLEYADQITLGRALQGRQAF